MAKKSRNKKKKERQVYQRPDQVVQRGPLLIERYGRFVRMRNTATPEEHAEFLARAKGANKEVLADLSSDVKALQALIARYDALELMHRAAYVLLLLFKERRSESEYTSEESWCLPTVEYLQYLVARTELAVDGAAPTEVEWGELWEQAQKVMRLTHSHLFLRGTTAEPPSAIDELRFMIDSKRLAVRVDRYPLFKTDHLRSALSPYERQIQDAYGIGVKDIIDGLEQIDEYQRSGVIGRYEQMRDATIALMERLAKSGYEISRDASPEEVARIQAALKTEEFKVEHERAQEAARLTLTPAIFEITNVTSLPKAFLSLLSVRPGESVLTTLTGPDHDDLSPLSPSVLHHKPFMEIDGRYYTFYHSGFEDRIADVIEANLFAKRPAEIAEMTDKRGKRLEADARELLTSLVRPDFAHENVYYPNPDDPQGLTELDLLMGVDDILLLVEAKAGGMDAAARRGAPDSLAQALSDLIIEGQRQSERAEKYVRSDDEVAFFDWTGKREVCRLRHSRFRKIFRVVVTREELGWVGAKIAILSVLDPNLSKSFPWHVSVDDLRVIAHLFKDDEIRFVHYLEVRLLAAAESALSQADEIEHVGLYNKMNYYHELPVADVDHMSFAADYMRDIDHYFMDLSSGIESPMPTQQMPAKLRELIGALRTSGLAGRFEVGSVILSMNSEAREGFARALDALHVGLQEGRQRRFRMSFDDVGLSISFAEGMNWDEELRRSAVQMQQSGCRKWLAVQRAATAPHSVLTIEVIAPDTFNAAELADAHATHDRKTREQITTQQPGRNDPCPCGSKRKFKKCHGA